MIRDRKMYVAPTPYAIATGLTGVRTLVVPADFKKPDGFREVGELTRTEAERIIVGYSFDLRTNEIKAETVENPSSGTEHHFVAYRCTDDESENEVILRSHSEDENDIEEEIDEQD